MGTFDVGWEFGGHIHASPNLVGSEARDVLRAGSCASELQPSVSLGGMSN